MSVQGLTDIWIELDGAVNARVVVPGALLRSDNLQSLSERDVRLLVDRHRVRVVLDLRTGHEVGREGPGPLATEAGVVIRHLSLYDDDEPPARLVSGAVRPWGGALEDESPDEPSMVRHYLSYLRRRPDSVVECVRTIARTDGAVLVHCAAGKDRTGMVVSMALEAAGAERRVVVEDYMRSAERIEHILRRLCSSETYRGHLEGTDIQRHTPVRETIQRALELVDERHGGAAAWLTANGLAAEDLALLRQRLSGS